VFWEPDPLGFGEVAKLLSVHALVHLPGGTMQLAHWFFSAFGCQSDGGGHLLIFARCRHDLNKVYLCVALCVEIVYFQKNMKIKLMDDMTEALKQRAPQVYKLVHSRDIIVPLGYCDPRWCSVVQCLMLYNDPALRQFAHSVGYGVALRLIQCRSPYYFVADEFAFAVANSDLPGDFRFAELKWPLDGQTFILSDKFCQVYYGFLAPFLSVVRLEAGRYPAHLHDKRLDGYRFLPVMDMHADMILMQYPYFGVKVPITYNSKYPMSGGIGMFDNTTINDATIFEDAYHGIPSDAKIGHELTKEEEQVFTKKAQHLALKLLLTISCLPSSVETGGKAREAISVQGRCTSPILMHPNIIGRNYRTQRKPAVAVPQGSHGVIVRSAPRFTIRRGHYAWQAKRFKNTEFVSVDQMPRTANGLIDFDKADTTMVSKFRVCHERIWIQGIVFDLGIGV
jgi:hypothetical protein